MAVERRRCNRRRRKRLNFVRFLFQAAQEVLRRRRRRLAADGNGDYGRGMRREARRQPTEYLQPSLDKIRLTSYKTCP